MIDLSLLFTYACDDVPYMRKDTPKAWITADKVNGEMFRSYPLFEFIPGTRGDEEPKHHGDFVIDIDTGEQAVVDAIKIIDHMEKVYDLGPEQWRIYLSGKKGVHLELPDTTMGMECGDILLTLAYKRLSRDIEGDLDIKLDLSMYNRGTGKPYRQPNVMRETGTCKRQIEFNDLFEITSEDDYRVACSEPGDTWEPSNTALNKSLAEKLACYLIEAGEQQETIKHAPKLEGDDLDRLALSIPPCVTVLANLSSNGNTSSTFNDVAMQLTAYAVSTGRSEASFLSGCHPFIASYPSSSLKTLGQRQENCRARYRTMAANGNQFSCGGILSLGFSGFDCAKCTVSPAGPPVSVEVMSLNDLEKLSTTLHIPDSVANPGGLISLGMQALSQPGLPDIPQYNLPVVLTTIANAIAGKIVYAGTWPNVYNIKVGPTSTGKTSSDTAVTDAINEAGVLDFYGPTDFASGPALMRSLMDNAKCMIVIDEATSLFRRYDRADPVSDGKRDALLEIFSKSGQKIKRAYSDSRNTVEIEYPCVSLTGNATPVIYDAIRQEDFDTGLMQRFDFWCYDGDMPERGRSTGTNSKLDAFAAGIAALKNAVPTGAGNLRQFLMVPTKLGITQKAGDTLEEWSRYVREKTNAANSDGEKGLLSRQYHLAIKYALIHLAATRPVAALFEPIDESDIEYGKEVAAMLCGWKISTAFTRVSQGDFHRQCEVFKKAIEAVMRMEKSRHLKPWQTGGQSSKIGSGRTQKRSFLSLSREGK